MMHDGPCLVQSSPSSERSTILNAKQGILASSRLQLFSMSCEILCNSGQGLLFSAGEDEFFGGTGHLTNAVTILSEGITSEIHEGSDKGEGRFVLTSNKPILVPSLFSNTATTIDISSFIKLVSHPVFSVAIQKCFNVEPSSLDVVFWKLFVFNEKVDLIGSAI